MLLLILRKAILFSRWHQEIERSLLKGSRRFSSWPLKKWNIWVFYYNITIFVVFIFSLRKENHLLSGLEKEHQMTTNQKSDHLAKKHSLIVSMKATATNIKRILIRRIIIIKTTIWCLDEKKSLHQNDRHHSVFMRTTATNRRTVFDRIAVFNKILFNFYRNGILKFALVP